MDCKVIYRLLLLVALFFSTQSFAVEFQGKFIQGHYIIGKTEPGTSILVDKKKVKVSKDGYFAFGIEKDRKFDIIITENNKDIIKKIQKRKYNIQKIEVAQKGDISFIANSKYLKHLSLTKASAVIIDNNYNYDGIDNTTLIVVNDAYLSLAKLIQKFLLRSRACPLYFILKVCK